jgi:23S rRNA (uracil1939-C5)-methyltransferase
VNTADVTIESIAAGGDGVARTGGVVVFVPRSAPGDIVRVRLETRKRFARGTIEDVLTASPDRVDPMCYHYRMDRCGGCQVQHINYAAQVRAKQAIIRDSLARIGRRDVALPEVEPSPDQWRYRRKLTLAMRRPRGGDWVIGLHPYDDPVGVFQLADCPITDERVLRVWRQVMEARHHFPPGNELRAAVQWMDDGASILVEGGDAWPRRSEFFDAVPLASSLWWRPANRGRMLVADRGTARGNGRGSASFAQVNPAMGDRLHEWVLDRARAYRPRHVVDAYAGSGATAIPLAADGAKVTAIELDKDAVARCAALLPEGSEAIPARVEDVIARVMPADVVLINPPRTGVHETVSRTLDALDAPPRAVIYVSCDPATLARDLARMPRYRIAGIRAFDMFPQTAHVETVCELVPDPAGSVA